MVDPDWKDRQQKTLSYFDQNETQKPLQKLQDGIFKFETNGIGQF